MGGLAPQTWRGEDIREISMSSIDLAAYLPMNLRGLSMVLSARTQCLQTTSFQYSGRWRSVSASVE